MATQNTGWKYPLTVNQDARRAVNNNHACYEWADLNDIKKEDNSHAYIPLSGGIDSTHASPVIYAYNYNFKIPDNATITNVSVLPVIQQSNWVSAGKITKIKTLKLKIGNSLTDYGTGNNLANDNYIQSTKVPIQKWSDESTWKHNGKYVFKGDKTTWGTSLTPKIINSTTFGCVFQVIGTESKKWTNPYVAKLLMDVEYTVPEITTKKVENQASDTKTTFQINNADVKFTSGVSNTIYTGLNVDNKDTGITITVTHKHTGQQSESPIVQINSNNILIGPQKYKSYTLPSIHFSSDEKEKVYTQTFNVYPNFIGGLQVIQVDVGSSSQLIRFDVTSASYSSMSDVEKEKYTNDGQFCKITNCTFKRNVVTNKEKGTGGAMYISTEHFKYGGNVYGTGDDANTVGKVGGTPNLEWNGKKIE